MSEQNNGTSEIVGSHAWAVHRRILPWISQEKHSDVNYVCIIYVLQHHLIKQPTNCLFGESYLRQVYMILLLWSQFVSISEIMSVVQILEKFHLRHVFCVIRITTNRSSSKNESQKRCECEYILYIANNSNFVAIVRCHCCHGKLNAF